MDAMEAAVLVANQEAENKAAGIGALEEGESDFIDGALLSGAGESDAPRAYTFVLKRGSREFRLQEPDAGTYNAFVKATQQAERQREALNRRALRLAQQKRSLDARFAASLEENAKETPEAIEELMEDMAARLEALQQEQAQALLLPMAANRAALEFCLRGWVRRDGVPFNAQTRAALSPSRVGQLWNACVERYLAGANTQDFLTSC